MKMQTCSHCGCKDIVDKYSWVFVGKRRYCARCWIKAANALICAIKSVEEDDMAKTFILLQDRLRSLKKEIEPMMGGK